MITESSTVGKQCNDRTGSVACRPAAAPQLRRALRAHSRRGVGPSDTLRRQFSSCSRVDKTGVLSRYDVFAPRPSSYITRTPINWDEPHHLNRRCRGYRWISSGAVPIGAERPGTASWDRVLQIPRQTLDTCLVQTRSANHYEKCS